ncbi:hypothetical protein QOT17_018574 [Balamuthia mandrillaris]
MDAKNKKSEIISLTAFEECLERLRASLENVYNALNTEFYHFSFKTGESVQGCSECFQKLIDQMTCSPQLEDSLAILCNALLEELVSGVISSCITNFPTSLANAVASS